MVIVAFTFSAVCAGGPQNGEFKGKFSRWLREFPLQQGSDTERFDLQVRACGHE